MEIIEWIKIMSAIGIYFVSIPLIRQINKFAYLKIDVRILPIVWYIPILNTVCIITLPLVTLLVVLLDKIHTAEYYKIKWDKLN